MKRICWSMIGLAAVVVPGTDARAGGVLWQEVPNVFGTQPCSGGGCYTHYARVADLDGDDDLDVIYPNDGGTAQPLVIYENDGAAGFTNVSGTAVDDFMGALRQVAIGDVDGDGDLDIYGPDADGNAGVLFINDGAGVFVDEGDERLPADPIPAGSTRFGDFDGDGALDIAVADHLSADSMVIYINDGEGVFTQLADAVPFDVGSDINDMDVFDVDRDFDLDIMTNAHGGANRIWINDGTGHFGDHPFTSSGGLHYGPGVCDVDNDGDIDIWIDNQGPNYTERLWINDGTGSYTDETVARVTGNPTSDDNGIICADVDSDGDMDGIVIALSTPERLLENDGDGYFTFVAGAFSGPTDSSLGAEMGDLNGDHRIDIATGQGESGSFVDRVFLGTDGLPTDTTAPRMIVWEEPPRDVDAGATVTIRFAVSDDAISDHGPRLASVYALIDPEGADTQVPAVFVGGDVFRVVLPAERVAATVTYRLCAVDPHDNSACTEDFTYDVAGGVGTGTGSDTGDDTSGDSESGTPDSSGGSEDTTPVGSSSDDGPADSSGGGSGSITGVSTDSSGGESSGTDTDPGVGDDGGGSGCGCRSDRPAPAGWLALVVLGAMARRRKRS
jgi:MYXO-CTERM domain-containing protein